MVTVIIPVRDRARLLERAADSVLQTSGVDFELIVVDDASRAPNEALYSRLQKLGHRVLRLPECVGPGRARNAGALMARGEWLTFLDSDDHWLPGKLQLHLASLERSGLPIGQAEEVWYRDGARVNPPKAHRITGGDLFARSLKAVCVSSSTVVLKKELFHSMGGFDEEFFVCEDYELWLRVAAVHEFEFCPQPLVVKYGGHQDQLSKALPAMDRFRILALVKGLALGAFSGREELVERELQRKLRILAKGSAKRGKAEAVNLCEAIASSEGEERLSLARALCSKWETRPRLS